MSKRAGKVSKSKKTVTSWNDALEEFIFWKQAQGLSKVTIKGYKDVVTCFFGRFPTSWQSPEIKKALMTHMTDDIMPATYNLRLIYLKGFFDWCINENYLTGNPLKGFKKRKAQPRIVNVEKDALEKLLKLPDQSTFTGLRDYALMLLTLDTGIRPKEALSLKIEDFDLKHNLVNIPATEAKTRVGRSLPLLPMTSDSIKRVINARHPEWEDYIPVFCTNEGKILNRNTWSDRMAKYSKGLGVKVRPYDLRHCFALYFLRNGGHAFALQKTLGHADMGMTKRYVNLTGQDLRETHKIASPLNGLVRKKNRVGKVQK